VGLPRCRQRLIEFLLNIVMFVLATCTFMFRQKKKMFVL
jgi:outer membrane lipopolysaccharide assembly protein LptE/RlpB